jgi:hypothetical protein
MAVEMSHGDATEQEGTGCGEDRPVDGERIVAAQRVIRALRVRYGEGVGVRHLRLSFGLIGARAVRATQGQDHREANGHRDVESGLDLHDRSPFGWPYRAATARAPTVGANLGFRIVGRRRESLKDS